jgi:ureidoacrylate peracid hydrolase
LEPISLQWLLDESSAALIIIDVQNEFCHPEGRFGKRGLDVRTINHVVTKIKVLIDAAHASSIPVVFIQNIEEDATDSHPWMTRPDGNESIANGRICRKGSWGVELFELFPAERDFVCRKFRFSAFFNTPLNNFLRSRDIQTVIVTGIITNVCVESTARDACMYDYYVVVPEDACATWSQDVHKASLSNISCFFGKVTDTQTILSSWKCRIKSKEIPQKFPV